MEYVAQEQSNIKRYVPADVCRHVFVGMEISP